MLLRDWFRFVVAMLALFAVHSLLFDIDDFDVTQFWVGAAMFTIIGAIRDAKPAEIVS